MDGISTKSNVKDKFLKLQNLLAEVSSLGNPTDQDNASWIGAYVDQMDQSLFDGLNSGRGTAPHPPKAMLKIVLYEMYKRILSPACWAREVLSDRFLQSLIDHIQPSRTALYQFRIRIGKIIDKIFQNLLKQAADFGLIGESDSAIDGTTLRSFGSRHRIVNQKTLNRRLGELSKEIELDEQSNTSAEHPKWMGNTIGGRISQLEKYKRANETLTQRVAANAVKPKSAQTAVERIYISLSDPESALSRDKERVFCPQYNVQICTDTKTSLILTTDLSNRATDVGKIGPVIDKARLTPGIELKLAHVDAGYTSLSDLKACLDRKVEVIGPVNENGLSKEKKSKLPDSPISKDKFRYDEANHSYTCPAGHAMPYRNCETRRQVSGDVVYERFIVDADVCHQCPLVATCLNGAKQKTIRRLVGQEIVEAQKAKMTDSVALASRVVRAQTVERTNADIKERISLRRFGVIGMERAKTCISTVALVLNLMTLRTLLRYDAKKKAATPTSNQEQVDSVLDGVPAF